ncbi:MAG: helix-turn-helix transcriptional regulator [Acidobacteriaceae bacterium]
MRSERERRKLSLSTIAAATKIGTHYLQAIEEEELEKLPGGIFNKGFVRAYAQYLRMDEVPLIADLVAKSEPPRPVLEAPSGERKRMRWLAAFRLP